MAAGFLIATGVIEGACRYLIKDPMDIRPRPNIISRPKVFLVKESTRIKIILIASYFFSEIELSI
ncbi:hypothetical protein MICAF_3120001 [Microcystis aeruginosa PCC 9807]|uniref:Uncharacterized protein n=1 Tax=Microcystis aeruginosa PCC 9807 TaxID=1160283 RepID=I4H6T0_MICAE|nr:hypothetical protein MICAF_3120001 [Microcystis aeruginosa PCC 9807]